MAKMLEIIKTNLRNISKKLLKITLPPKLNDLFERVYAEIIYDSVKNDYIQKLTENTRYDLKTIGNLLKRIENIDNHIKCAHGPFEFYVMQAMILSLNIEGPILELGCYKGGSTAKLSLLCKLTGRKLYAFDSFEGLPPPSTLDLKHNYMPWVYGKKYVEYSESSYAGSLEEVKRNVRRYGEISVCEFVKGYFENTLPNFKKIPAFIFMDVDYIESARTVIKHLWPKLRTGGYLFSHEALVSDFIRGLSEPQWWEKELKSHPPFILGAGYGSCWRSKFFVLPSNVFYLEKTD
jgi:hypothetical protein